MIIKLIIILSSMLLSAFFSGMEIAFVSSNKMHLELEKKKDTLLAKVLKRLTQKPSKFITTMLVGNNIALVIYGYFMGDLLMGLFGDYIQNEFLLLLTQTFISTIAILVTAEFLPKAVFRIYANEAMNLFAFPAYFFFLLFYVISRFITLLSDFFLRVFFNVKRRSGATCFYKGRIRTLYR